MTRKGDHVLNAWATLEKKICPVLLVGWCLMLGPAPNIRVFRGIQFVTAKLS